MTDSNTLLNLLQQTCEPDYLYRQLVEECTELAQAALKKVRSAKDEISPGAKAEVDDNYLEELADVGVMLELAESALDMQEREAVHKIMQFKRERMEERLKKKCPKIRLCNGIEPSPSRLELSSEEVRKWAAFFNGMYGRTNHNKEEEQ